MSEKYLTDLNSAQREAVEHTEGALLILAGAGAGKTKTITHRILHIIKKGASPHSILAITFTNKAASEMRERVYKLLATDPDLNRPISFSERPFVSTFHALGVHIIKENAGLLGLTRSFSIFDRGDSKQAVKESLVEIGLDPKQYEPGRILGAISREKGNFVTVEQYAERASDYIEKIITRVWRAYDDRLAKEKALDFDDLLLKTAVLLSKNETVRTHYQNIWKYIHVDEYQDTNKVQYEIVRQLAERDKNLCVVGDIDQNIYTWRGATIKNILNFERDYPAAKVILLEQNYRSTKTILSVANAIIEKNTERVKKTLFTENHEGEKISLYGGYDENDEAAFIADKAAELMRNGMEPKEIAVLYRANFQSRVLEEAFLSLDIPYQVLGTRFFERKEVKDLLSYVRAALNPDSLSDIKRIINMPARGIGKVTLLKLFAGQEGGLPEGVRLKIANFRNVLTAIREKIGEGKVSETIKFAIKATGLEDMFKGGKDEDEERLLNLYELVSLSTKYDAMAPREGIEKLIEDAALASDQDEMKEEKNAVRLMTVHASKGLEFDYVFISGLEADLFPHRKGEMAEIPKEVSEEERRLFYVALTRAREKVFLTYASFRTIFGQKRVNMPSEFITDIDEFHLVAEERGAGIKIISFE